jgi:hypothetical protein
MALSIPDIPMLAAGGDITRGGWATVGERGKEQLYLLAGAQVRPDRGSDQGPDAVRVDGQIEVKATCPGCGIVHLREFVSSRGGSAQAALGEGPG